MLTEENIRDYLEDEFHIKFIVEKNFNNYKITLDGTNHESFFVSFSIKEDIRLTIEAEPDKYGRKFLEIINSSNTSKREMFCKYWKELGENKLSVKINSNPISIEEFINNEDVWNTFYLRYSVSPYFDDGDNKNLNILETVSSVIAMVLSLVDYTIEGYEEGEKTVVHANRYERNPINRQLCLLAKGYKCSICGFDFEKTYGVIGAKFIEVHHTIPVSKMEDGHIVDPIKELFPVCSNCHSMIHKKEPPFTIDEMKLIVERIKNENK